MVNKKRLLFKIKKEYKPPIKTIIDKPEKVVPDGYFCNEPNGIGHRECPFLQWRKASENKMNRYIKVYNLSVPWCNTELQYCSLLKAYLSIQDCIKDCGINDPSCPDKKGGIEK